MIFDIAQKTFDSMGQWHAWRLGLDLAPPRVQATAEELAYNRFYRDLVGDLFANSQAYGVPQASYEETIPDDTEREDRLREARQKARKAIEGGLVDFLFQLGKSGENQGDTLRLAPAFYDALVTEKVKKNRLKGFPNIFERMGMSFGLGETVIIANTHYPGALAGLAWLAKACAAIPGYGFYFFRRCDFGVCDGKRLPLLADGFPLLTQNLSDEVQSMDELLCKRKFKHELFVGDGDAGYRVRYQKKSGNLAYWSRIRSWSSIELAHNLRWDFASELTPQLFEQLDATRPGLAGQIFEDIKKCAHCYTNCIMRKEIAYHGKTQEVCQEVGWQMYGGSPADFENLCDVITILDEFGSQKK